MSDATSSRTAAACAASALGVFVIEVVTPRGVAESVLYTVVVAAALRAPGPRLVLAVAAGCSVLTVAGYLLSPGDAPWWASAINRGLTLVAVWTIALVGLQRQTLLAERQQPLAEREELLTKALNEFIRVCAWCKKVHHGGPAWRPLEAYVRDRTAATFTHGMCPDCYHTQMHDLPPAAG